MSRRKVRNEVPRAEIEHQQERRELQEKLNNLREWAYLRGQNIARELYSTIAKFKSMPSPAAGEHSAEVEVARGFIDGLNLALDSARSLVLFERRKHFLSFLMDDLVDNVDKGLRIMGDGWVSPWIVHAEKLAAPNPNARRLQNLTMGLYRQFQAFDAGRCITGLDEDYRVAAIEMLDSYSRFGRHDRAFMDAAEALMKGEEP